MFQTYPEGFILKKNLFILYIHIYNATVKICFYFNLYFKYQTIAFYKLCNTQNLHDTKIRQFVFTLITIVLTCNNKEVQQKIQ